MATPTSTTGSDPKVESYDVLAEVPVVVDGQERGRIVVKGMLA